MHLKKCTCRGILIALLLNFYNAPASMQIRFFRVNNQSNQISARSSTRARAAPGPDTLKTAWGHNTQVRGVVALGQPRFSVRLLRTFATQFAAVCCSNAPNSPLLLADLLQSVRLETSRSPVDTICRPDSSSTPLAPSTTSSTRQLPKTRYTPATGGLFIQLFLISNYFGTVFSPRF
jgi:hypothetical protein